MTGGTRLALLLGIVFVQFALPLMGFAVGDRSLTLAAEVGESRQATVEGASGAREPVGQPGNPIVALLHQILLAAVLALPVACLAWTVTKEEILSEVRQACVRVVNSDAPAWKRKLCYLLTCEYCFSHYVAALFVGLTGLRVGYPGFAGGLIAWLIVIWFANHYMSVYLILRQRVKKASLEAKGLGGVTGTAAN